MPDSDNILSNLNPVIDCHNHVGVELAFYLQGSYPYGQSASALVEQDGAERITDWIVFPFVTNLATEFGGDRGKTPYAFENRRLLQEVHDYFPEHANRILPFLILDPSRKVAEQVESITALRERFRFHGFKIQPTLIQSPIRALFKQGSGFLELARAWDLPFIIHSSIAPDDLWSQCADILDIAEANPDIRFCLAHSCRFHQPSLERLATLPNTWFDCSAHRIHCEGVVRELPIVAVPGERFPSDYSDPARVLADLHAAYPDRLLWGSDSPFQSWIAAEGDNLLSLKATYREEVETLYALPEPARRAIANHNTRRFLGL